MSEHTRDLADGLMRIRHALQAMGGRAPSRIVVDQKTADAILYLSKPDAPFLDHSAHAAHEKTWLATICGIEFHAEGDRTAHVRRSLQAAIDDHDRDGD